MTAHLTLSLSDDCHQHLCDLASQSNQSNSEVIQKSLALYSMAVEADRNGKMVGVLDKDTLNIEYSFTGITKTESLLTTEHLSNINSDTEANQNIVIAPVEHGIQPVCDALNAINGVRTVWSCEGHPEYNMLPYVVFVTTQEVAFNISRSIRAASLSGKQLFYNWEMTANFREDGSLQYMIKPNDRRLNKKILFLSAWSQKKMDDELKNLAKTIESMSGK